MCSIAEAPQGLKWLHDNLLARLAQTVNDILLVLQNREPRPVPLVLRLLQPDGAPDAHPRVGAAGRHPDRHARPRRHIRSVRHLKLKAAIPENRGIQTRNAW